jgi:hypothetical protein
MISLTKYDVKIDDFLTSYSSASSRANALDDRIQLNASALASQLRMSTSTATKLVDLHILNLRQTVGSLEFTTSKTKTATSRYGRREGVYEGCWLFKVNLSILHG